MYDRRSRTGQTMSNSVVPRERGGPGGDPDAMQTFLTACVVGVVMGGVATSLGLAPMAAAAATVFCSVATAVVGARVMAE